MKTFEQHPQGYLRLAGLPYEAVNDGNVMKAPKGKLPYIKDGETLVASIGPIAVTAEEIWKYERISTSIALKHDFYPDGWELAE